MENWTILLYNTKKKKRGGNKLTLQQKIKVACELAGMTLTELAGKCGSSQQAFSKRVKNGKFTQEELEKIALYLGAEYRSGFYFPDGNKVE